MMSIDARIDINMKEYFFQSKDCHYKIFMLLDARLLHNA